MDKPETVATDWLESQRARRAIVVADVVESVRLMQAHEADTIDRWRRFVAEVRKELLPGFGGRLVKSLGDGMLLEFESVPPAIAAAFELQRRIAAYNVGRSTADSLFLRLGLHLADVVIDDLDIYGPGVNLAARLATLADVGQVIVSREVLTAAVPGMDADFEDLGACFLKHIDAPVPAYRAWPVSVAGMPATAAARRADSVAGEGTVDFDLRPIVAILPLDRSEPHGARLTPGDLLSDTLVARLSGSDRLRVTSRLSTQVFRGRSPTLKEVEALLGAAFVVSGSFDVRGTDFVALVEVADVRTGHVIGAERITGRVADLLLPSDEHSAALAAAIVSAIGEAELRRVRTRPMPTLEGFSLQFGATTLMHRPALQDFERARLLLEHLAERFPRAAGPRAWIAKWYVLRVTRGIVPDSTVDADRALDHALRAADLDTDSGFAPAMEAFVHCHMRRDLDSADKALNRALSISPNEPLAWLVRCVVEGFRGHGEPAWQAAQRALALSPLDPLRYYFDALAASAAVASSRLDEAVTLSRRSLRARRDHLPTLRALTVALAERGEVEEAATVARSILALEPSFTLKGYQLRAPPGSEATRVRYAHAMRLAGLPEG